MGSAAAADLRLREEVPVSRAKMRTARRRQYFPIDGIRIPGCQRSARPAAAAPAWRTDRAQSERHRKERRAVGAIGRIVVDELCKQLHRRSGPDIEHIGAVSEFDMFGR